MPRVIDFVPNHVHFSFTCFINVHVFVEQYWTLVTVVAVLLVFSPRCKYL